jgi:hypothetical protein
VAVQRLALSAVQQLRHGRGLAARLFPRQSDFLRRERRDVPGEFVRDRLWERDVSGLATFRQGQDELAPDDLDRTHDVQSPAEELDVIDREPEGFALPQPAPGALTDAARHGFFAIRSSSTAAEKTAERLANRTRR